MLGKTFWKVRPECFARLPFAAEMAEKDLNRRNARRMANRVTELPPRAEVSVIRGTWAR